jgi:hypothetical protein
LRGFPSADLLLRMLLLHVARGYSLRETAVQAKLANWADVSDVALLKRLRNSEEWLRSLVYRLAPGKRCVPARRSDQYADPNCGWHDRQRTRQDGKPVADSIQPETAESDM